MILNELNHSLTTYEIIHDPQECFSLQMFYFTEVVLDERYVRLRQLQRLRGRKRSKFLRFVCKRIVLSSAIGYINRSEANAFTEFYRLFQPV